MDLSALTLQQLRYLVAIDTERSFGTAAQVCHVSQPALSMQVQRAEEILGVILFDRSIKPVIPTEKGEVVLRHARAVLRELERLAESLAQGAALSGRARLGILPSLAPTLLPRLLPALTRLHPQVQWVVEELRTDPLVRALQEGRLDAGVAVTPLGVRGLFQRRLFHEPFSVYLSPDHPLAAQEVLRQSDLVDQRPWLLAEGHCFRTQVLHLCRVDHRGAEAELPALLEAESFHTLLGLVDAGMGLTLIPELLARALPEARRVAQVRRFHPPIPVREVSLIYVREHQREALLGSLARLLAVESLVEPGTEERVIPPLEDAPASQ